MLLAGCGSTAPAGSSAADGAAAHELTYRFASAEEGSDLMLSNEAYFDGLSQDDLDFRMQRKGADAAEYKEFAAQQTRDFTDEEKAFLDEYFAAIKSTVESNGYQLPFPEEIVLIKTTGKEECDTAAYTHGSQIYVSESWLQEGLGGDEETFERMSFILTQKLFHCLTRSDPAFRENMYSLISFTVADQEFEIPSGVKDYQISDPDVERHDAYASFIIDGEPVDCFMAYMTTEHFEKEGDSFSATGNAVLIPTDGSDQYYTPDQAANFDTVFGLNTRNETDPEEALAQDFAYALVYGTEGPGGSDFPSLDIIEGVINYMLGEG